MATCKHCGKPLILSSGKCIYCGAAEKCSQEYSIQRVNNDTTVRAVDLGLPSGTKWATCNLGAKNPWEYGGYYAWGEIEEKNIYNRETYKWGACQPRWKYCNDVFCEVIDNKWVLETEDDAAHENWGENWHIPTLEEYNELLSNCHNEWSTMNNVRGLKLVSKHNGKSIFFPAAGLRMDSSLINQDCGYYKSASLYGKNSEGAYVFLFIPERSYQPSEIHIISNLRELGQSIRPVFL